MLIVFSLLVSVLLLAGCGNESKDSGASSEEEAVDFSKKPIKLIVPWSAGGITDVTARLLAEEAVNHLPEGAEVVVENRPGGTGTIGAAEVANAEADGFTLLISPLVPVTESPSIRQTPYEYDDFDPVLQVLSTPTAFAVGTSNDIATYEDFVQYAKDNPGEFKYATGGVGTLDHIVMEAIALKENIDIKHVPYEGAAPIINDILGGHIDGGHLQIPGLLPYVEEGDVRIAWNSGSEGFAYMPKDTPTLEGKLDLPEMDAKTSIVGPKGIPEETLNIIVDAFKKTMDSEKFKEKMENANLEPAFAGPEELGETIETRYQTSKKIIEESGIAE
ncbi:Bug family tripartite tricarboxylate transporter substrate binding protein [Lentibacillus amyloliquefaciens]|nr:tripartite tricarboxylate transporter substrate binding protein [Lentibacillus amyloliquefaciens]